MKSKFILQLQRKLVESQESDILIKYRLQEEALKK